jgi:hypothetical protein
LDGLGWEHTTRCKIRDSRLYVKYGIHRSELKDPAFR